MASNLIFKNAEEAKNAIMASQQKEIADLYKSWSDEIGERAKFYSHQSTVSSVVSERQMRELQKQITATSQQVSNEIYGKIKNNMYLISDAVVADNVKWLQSFGFSSEGLNAAFSYVPDNVVRNIVTGQIYDSGWSLSKAIWSDNEKALKDVYEIVAKGVAQNMPIYNIAKNLEAYVSPDKRKSWNLKAPDGVKIFKKSVDYNAQRLARTLVQHSYQQSFIATTQKNPFITEYIWHSNGSRVCPLCLDRDGAHFSKDSLPMDHPNGMCVMEPVVAENMVDQLADWFNSPDGTYPEIDAFAGNFGYEAKKGGGVNDYLAKYGKSDKTLSAWKQSMTPIQKAEAKLLKDAEGLTWEKFYSKYVYSGDASEVAEHQAKIKAAKAAKKAEKKAQTQTVKVFSDAQEKYLKPYGFSPDKMPVDFDDWSHKISHSQASEILQSMGTSWGDPHPYQQLMKYYNANLTSSNFASKAISKVDDVTTAVKANKAATAAKTANVADDALSEEKIIKMIKSFDAEEYNAVTKLFAKYGFDVDDFFDEYGELDANSTMLKEAMNKVLGKNTATTIDKVDDVIYQSDEVFDAVKWTEAVKANNVNAMDTWTDDWLKVISAEERSGVRTYTGNAYWDMNDYLRGRKSSTGYMDDIKACQSALSKASLPRETIVRRGSDYNMLTELGMGKITPENKDRVIGAIVQDKGFMSTSPDPRGGFHESIEYVIKLPQGSQAMYVNSISLHPSEKELLINCGGKFVVEDVEFYDAGFVKKIYMTLVNLKS